MLQRYVAMVPTGVTVAEARQLAEFLPIAGHLSLVTLVLGANAGVGGATFDVKVNGDTVYGDPDDRPTIPEGEQYVAQTIPDDVIVILTDRITVHLVTWPTGGLIGPCSIEVAVDDLLATDATLPLEAYVQAYFKGILGRIADSTELAAHLFDLTNACYDITFVVTAQGLVGDLLTSAEFAGLATTNTQFVTALYRGYFNREPDATGLAFHVGELVGGMPRATKQAQFGDHREFINRSALYCRNQLTQADATLIAGEDPETFVNDLADARIAAPETETLVNSLADARILLAHSGKTPDEYVRDTMAAAFADSVDLDFSANDPGDTATAVLTPTGVTAGTYGSATTIPVIQLDAKGRAVVASVVGVSSGGQASYGADAVPAVPGTLDEEFNGASTNALFTKTVTNSTVGAVAPVHDQNVTIPSHFYVKFTLPGQAISFRATAPSPTGDWSMTAKCHAALRTASAGFSIEADDATFNNAIRAYWQCHASNSYAAGLDQQTAGTWTFFGSGQRDAMPLTTTTNTIHLQRVGNVWSAWYSLNGISFIRTGDSTITKSFTVATIVLQIQMSAQTMPCIYSADWIRYNWRFF